MDTITNIPVSSLTYALKGQKVLERYGYKAWAGRDHNRVSGCGYQLTVRGAVLPARFWQARKMLRMTI